MRLAHPITPLTDAGKREKGSVSYRVGETGSGQHCDACVYYDGSAGPTGAGRCARVAGQVVGRMVCDLFLRGKDMD